MVEHLTNLGELPTRGAVLTAVPPAIAGMATFPVRTFAALQRTQPAADRLPDLGEMGGEVLPQR